MKGDIYIREGPIQSHGARLLLYKMCDAFYSSKVGIRKERRVMIRKMMRMGSDLKYDRGYYTSFKFYFIPNEHLYTL